MLQLFPLSTGYRSQYILPAESGITSVAIDAVDQVGIAFVRWWSSDCSIYRRPDSIVQVLAIQVRNAEDVEAEDR
jgi:hypothetical protein